jgi:hypothetical protein
MEGVSADAIQTIARLAGRELRQTVRDRGVRIARICPPSIVLSYDGASNLATMEVYDVDEDRWEMSASLTAHEGGVGIGVIPLAPPPT